MMTFEIQISTLQLSIGFYWDIIFLDAGLFGSWQFLKTHRSFGLNLIQPTSSVWSWNLTFSFTGVAALWLPRVREARVLALVRRGPSVDKSLELLLASFGVLLFGLSPPGRADGGLVVGVDEDPGPRVPDLASLPTSSLVAAEVSSLLVSHQQVFFSFWKGRWRLGSIKSLLTSLNICMSADLQWFPLYLVRAGQGRVSKYSENPSSVCLEAVCRPDCDKLSPAQSNHTMIRSS